MSRLLKFSRLLRQASDVLSTAAPHRVPAAIATQEFSTCRALQKKHTNLPPRPKPPPDTEIDESFLKGSGPGGQKINKTNSAVQLKHIPTGLVIKCQATRSRTENRKIARQLLADKLDDMSRGEESRSSVVGEVKRKKRASAAKKKRRKYRKLEEGAVGAGMNDETLDFEDEYDDDVEGAEDAAEDTTEDPVDDKNPRRLDKEKT
ncbi:hypothetical protein AB5N19_13588 [Seiridium cardinale]